MKDFLKMLGASILGCGIVLFVGFFLIFGIIGALVSMGERAVPSIPQNAILQIGFEKPLLEQSTDNPLAEALPSHWLNPYQSNGTGYYSVVRSIERAATDTRIQMIYMNLNYLNADISHIEELRNALKAFRATGKAIIAYADSYSQAAYYLATAADKIYLNPEGEVYLRGFAISTRYYGALFDELGVNVQFVHHGKYKSGGEPYVNSQMSPEDKEQLNAFLQSAWGHWAQGMAEARGIPEQEINRITETHAASNATEAISLALADELMYKDQLIDQLCKLQDVEKEKQLRLVSMENYISAAPVSKAKNKIAVLYAQGAMYTGKGHEDIYSDNYTQELRRLQADSSVKAVVLRINSPGGDARAAAIITREIKLLKATKPVIISMGDAAASGGYWLACMGDRIFSSSATLTGSIGAYGLTYNGQEGLNKWLKVKVETVRTHSSSDMGSLYRPLTPVELARMQKGIDETYKQFIAIVAEGRARDMEMIESVAQGRVWSGSDALQSGLVDQIGGLSDAIAYAAEAAQITDYQLKNYPTTPSFLEKMMENISGSAQALSANRDPQAWMEQFRKSIEKACKQGVQARIPYLYEISY